MSVSVRGILSREEIQALTMRSDLRGWWGILRVWISIGLTFAALALWPNPLTFILAIIMLGSLQLALAVLTHEASHRTLFKTRSLNDAVSDWLCARPIWLDVYRYREHHMRHHAHTGTERDPDKSLVAPFPTTRGGLLRKLLRDISGLSGLRRIVGLVLMDIGVFEFTVSADPVRRPRNGRQFQDYLREGVHNMWPMAAANLILAGLLALAGAFWLYGAWVLAHLTTFSVFIRVRSIAEHACMEPGPDILRNTRTTRAGWLARLTVAPMKVNYHAEHHLMASVPYYRLPLLHKLLVERAALPVTPGYWQVLRTASAAVAE